MTRSAESMHRLCLTALASLALAGCGLFASKPPVRSATPVATEPAAPAVPVQSASKGDPDQRFKDALKLMKDRQQKEAYDAFLQLAKDFPEFSGPLTDLAILQSNQKQRAPSIINFQKALKDNPQNYVAQNWLGTLQREGGDYVAAQAAYRGAIASKSDYAPAHLNLAILYDVYLKQPQDALAEYREYQRIAGTDRLIVSAWIRELEDRIPSPAPAAPSNPSPTLERKS